MDTELGISVPGVSLGTVAAGIKYAGRNDLVVIGVPEGAACAAVFTQNAFCAAPVQLAKAHLKKSVPRYLLINSGNANAGTGDQGMQDALACCRTLAEQAGCETQHVLPFSTGVIGENLPADKIEAVLGQALSRLSECGWEDASQAIMTTDTVPKVASRRVEVDGEVAVITGMAKGSGMIRPDMATMLAFIATDMAVDNTLLQRCLEQAVVPSFNSITVDGDTSTNDSCILLASGCANISVTDSESRAYQALSQAVNEVCMELARAIVKDAEGATKLVSVQVESAQSEGEAEAVAYTVAHSPLVKTALFASDPNWGRILAAVGRAGVQNFDISLVEIWLDDVCIVCNGGRSPDYTEEAGQQVMDQSEFSVRIVLGRGDVKRTVLTCDFSYDYVRINAEYRT